MINEIWKPVKGFEGFYEVSNLGRVRSLDRVVSYERFGKIQRKPVPGIVLKAIKCHNGYLHANLKNGSNKRNCAIHRLVAEAFIPNPDKLPIINHINENKEDNRAKNLEWCDNKYNVNYGRRALKLKKTRMKTYPYKIEMVRKDGRVVQVFENFAEISSVYGNAVSINAHAVCIGKRATCINHIWRFMKK